MFFEYIRLSGQRESIASAFKQVDTTVWWILGVLLICGVLWTLKR